MLRVKRTIQVRYLLLGAVAGLAPPRFATNVSIVISLLVAVGRFGRIAVLLTALISTGFVVSWFGFLVFALRLPVRELCTEKAFSEAIAETLDTAAKPTAARIIKL